jgi:hypothetical protein
VTRGSGLRHLSSFVRVRLRIKWRHCPRVGQTAGCAREGGSEDLRPRAIRASTRTRLVAARDGRRGGRTIQSPQRLYNTMRDHPLRDHPLREQILAPLLPPPPPRRPAGAAGARLVSPCPIAPVGPPISPVSPACAPAQACARDLSAPRSSSLPLALQSAAHACALARSHPPCALVRSGHARSAFALSPPSASARAAPPTFAALSRLSAAAPAGTSLCTPSHRSFLSHDRPPTRSRRFCGGSIAPTITRPSLGLTCLHDGCALSRSRRWCPASADGPHAPLHLAHVASSVHSALVPATHPRLFSASAWSSTACTTSSVDPLAPPCHPCTTLLSRRRIGLLPAHVASSGPRSLLSNSVPPAPPRQLPRLPHNSVCCSASARSPIAPPCLAARPPIFRSARLSPTLHTSTPARPLEPACASAVRLNRTESSPALCSPPRAPGRPHACLPVFACAHVLDSDARHHHARHALRALLLHLLSMTLTTPSALSFCRCSC